MGEKPNPEKIIPNESAFANVHASMGRTPYEDIDPEAWTVAQLEKALRSGWRGLGDRY